MEYYREVINRPEPKDPADIETTGAPLDIDTSPPSKEEARIANNALKNGKACGVDIHVD